MANKREDIIVGYNINLTDNTLKTEILALITTISLIICYL